MNGTSTTIVDVIDFLSIGNDRPHDADITSRLSRLSLFRRARVDPSPRASRLAWRAMGPLDLSAAVDSIDLEARRSTLPPPVPSPSTATCIRRTGSMHFAPSFNNETVFRIYRSFVSICHWGVPLVQAPRHHHHRASPLSSRRHDMTFVGRGSTRGRPIRAGVQGPHPGHRPRRWAMGLRQRHARARQRGRAGFIAPRAVDGSCLASGSWTSCPLPRPASPRSRGRLRLCWQARSIARLSLLRPWCGAGCAAWNQRSCRIRAGSPYNRDVRRCRGWPRAASPRLWERPLRRSERWERRRSSRPPAG